jgi:hypothetical protein
VSDQAIYKLIPLVSRDVGSIAKDRKNSAQGFNYRGIDDVLDAFHVPLAKHGVFVTPSYTIIDTSERPTKSGGTQFVVRVRGEFTFYGPDGSSVTAATVGEAMDTGDKATNKAMSVAMKYAMFQVFAVPVSGVMDDADADSPEETPALTKEQREAAECIKACNTAIQLQDFWKGLDKADKAALSHVKDARKKELGL